jgi:HSP20 family molecular chaperone IbpA
MDHWFRAQADLFHPSHSEIEEDADSVMARTEVPGFSADQLEVGLEPHRVTIVGKRETQHEQKRGKIVYADGCSGQNYRVLDLPAEVALGRANVTLRNGILELELSKAIATPKSRAAA